MVKVLMTGFAPFGGGQSNPSWEAVRQVRAHKAVELRAEELPVTFAGAGKRVTELIAEFRPHLGTYVCNHVYYTALRYIQLHMLGTQAVFLHVPCDAEMAAERGLPGMTVQEMARGLQSIVDAAGSGEIL